VSPPCVAATHLQRRYRHCSEDCRRCVGGRRCHRGSETTGGLRPPLFVGVTVAGRAMRIARATSACSARLGYAPRSCSRAVRPPTELRLLRCTNEQSALGTAGVSPPWDVETPLQRRFRNCSVDCRPVCWRTLLQSRSCNHGGLTPPALVRECAFVHRKSRFFNVERTTCTRSGGREPAVFVGNARARMTTPGFTQRRRTRTKSGGREPAV